MIATITRTASVKELPSAESVIVKKVSQDQIVEIVGNERYYYLIEFEDPETNEIFQGYISKRSVHQIDIDESSD